jgi:hypothetical protein
MLKLQQRKGKGQGASLSAKLTVNKHRKGRKSRWAINHSPKQGRKWITELIS